MSLFKQLSEKYGAVRIMLAMLNEEILDLNGKEYIIDKFGTVTEAKNGDSN